MRLVVALGVVAVGTAPPSSGSIRTPRPSIGTS